MPAKALEVNNLSTHFITPRGVIRAVNGISFEVKKGQTLGIVGESGCGKSVMALSLLGLIDLPGRIVGGEVWLKGDNLLKLSKKRLQKVRGKEISLIFQDPMTSLNPVLTVGTQLIETVISHEEISKSEARQRAVANLAKVGLPDPPRIMGSYAFQLSGGMRQRVMIAMALCLQPLVLIADEPTTALDVTVQAQILAEIGRLQQATSTAIILISHDLGVIAAMADDVAVMYAGSIVEFGPVPAVLASPAHPYTRALLASLPRLAEAKKELQPIHGQPPSLLNLPEDCCPFLSRCRQAGEECQKHQPVLRPFGPNRQVACIEAISHSSGGREADAV